MKKCSVSNMAIRIKRMSTSCAVTRNSNLVSARSKKRNKEKARKLKRIFAFCALVSSEYQCPKL